MSLQEKRIALFLKTHSRFYGKGYPFLEKVLDEKLGGGSVCTNFNQCCALLEGLEAAELHSSEELSSFRRNRRYHTASALRNIKVNFKNIESLPHSVKNMQAFSILSLVEICISLALHLL